MFFLGLPLVRLFRALPCIMVLASGSVLLWYGVTWLKHFTFFGFMIEVPCNPVKHAAWLGRRQQTQLPHVTITGFPM